MRWGLRPTPEMSRKSLVRDRYWGQGPNCHETGLYIDHIRLKYRIFFQNKRTKDLKRENGHGLLPSDT